MSNYLAVATVTAALQRVLQSVIETDVPGSKATMVRPDAPGHGVPDVGVNIFLYEVAPNAALRNADLPTRNGNGQAVQRPTAALDLHYLLSFYEKDNDLAAQRVLGSVVRHLHSHPLLTRKMVQSTLIDPLYSPYLATSNLADAVEQVRFSPLSLSLEELSKLWSIFFQTPYALSTAYRASVVFIEEELTPVTPLPVRERQVFVVPFQQPFIENVDPQIIASGATLTISGQNLRGDVTKLKFGASLATPATVTGDKITVALPAVQPALQPGVRTVQVIHDFDFGTPNEPHRGFESNVAPFILRPQILLPIVKTTVPDPQGGPPLPALQLTADVTIGENQRVALLLNSTAAVNPTAYSFWAPARGADSTSITIAIPGVGAGLYFIRLQIDGAESSLDLDPASLDFGPTLTLP
jgi:hypothetical protein